MDEVLSSIDATLAGADEDWDVSGDAMRWTPPMADRVRDFIKATTGQDLHPWQAQLVADMLEDRRRRAEQPPDPYPPPPDSAAADLNRIQQNLDVITDEVFGGFDEFHHFGPGQLAGIRSNSDSIPVRLSPAEALLPGPNGTAIHIRGAYGDQPTQITQLDLDDTEDEHT